MKDKFENEENPSYKDQKWKLETAYNDTCISLILGLKANLMKVSKGLAIIEEFLTDSIIYYNSTYDKMYYGYMEKLSETEKRYGKEAAAHSIWAKCLNTYKEVALMEEQYVKIFNTLKTDLQTITKRKGKQRKDKTKFELTSHLTLPVAEIEYETEYVRFPQPIIYKYKVKDLKEILNVSIYQLSINHDIIIKCKHCGKYSIPNKKNQQYCDRNCKGAFARKKSNENSSKAYEHYRKLYNRYKNNRTYEKDFEELKKLYIDCKSKSLDDEETLKILLDFEKSVKENYAVKRGRPTKK